MNDSSSTKLSRLPTIPKKLENGSSPRITVVRNARGYSVMYATCRGGVLEAVSARDPQLIADHIAAHHPGVTAHWFIRP